MPQGLTLQELQQMGATPTPPAGQKKGLTLQELQAMKAAPAATPPPAPPQGNATLNAIGQGAKNALGAVTNFGEGFIKGGLQTAFGASALGERVLLDPIEKAIRGTTPTQAPLGAQVLKSGRFAAQGTAQKVGVGAERVAEGVAAGALTGNPYALTPGGVVGRAALAAGTQGTLEAMHQGEVNKEVGKSAAIAAGTSLAFSAGEAILKSLPENLWSKMLKRTPNEILKKPGAAEQAGKTGLVGYSRSNLVKQAGETIQKFEVQLDEALAPVEGTIDGSKVASYLDGLKEAYAAVPGESGSVDTIEAIQQELIAKGQLDPVEANELKRTIYRIVKNSYGKGFLQVGVKEEAQKVAAAGIKQELEKLAPEVQGLNQQQAVYIEIQKSLEKALAKTQSQVGVANLPFGLFDVILGVGGYSALGPQGLALLGGKKVIESTAVRSGVAAMANLFNGLSPTQKLMFYNGITSLVNQARKK